MPDRWLEAVEAHPQARAEIYQAEAEAVITDGGARFGGWLALSNKALYVGRQGKLGMGKTKSVGRVPVFDVEWFGARPSAKGDAYTDVAVEAASKPLAAILRSGRVFVEAMTRRMGIAQLQRDYAGVAATKALLLAEMERLSDIRRRLQDLGTDVDVEFCQSERERLGVAGQVWLAATEPRWEPDPTGRWSTRWWDGSEWTLHVSDGIRSSIDPYP